jgi:hypothetical protein
MEDYSRFDLVFDDTAEEHVEKKEKKEKKLKELRKKSEEERRVVEEKGECEGCGDKQYIRWVRHGEFYLCAECFMHDLQCEADIQVPMNRVSDMDGYDEYLCWDDLWENNE